MLRLCLDLQRTYTWIVMDHNTSERLAAKIKELESFAEADLLAHIQGALDRERRMGAYVVACLAVIERRRIHLARGYSSLYDFATRGLGLDEAGAWQRVQIARASTKVPDVLTKVADSRISVAVAGKVSGRLNAQNAEALLGLCEGKSCRDAEVLIAAHQQQQTAVTPSLRRGRESQATAPGGSERLAAAAEDRFNIRLSVSQRFHDNMRRLGLLLGMYDIKYRMEEVLGRSLNDSLDKRDPMRKMQRMAERSKKNTNENEQAPSSAVTDGSINVALKHALLQKSDYQCEFIGPDGIRCASRTMLEIDHRVPRAKGGTSEADNLQVLCRAHNQHAADVIFGRDFMEQKRSGCSD